VAAKPRARFLIHPSIDSLVQRIAEIGAKTPADEVAALRESCRGKIRSYPIESYLRSSTDPVAARTRYDIVARFAAGN